MNRDTTFLRTRKSFWEPIMGKGITRIDDERMGLAGLAGFAGGTRRLSVGIGGLGGAYFLGLGDEEGGLGMGGL